MIITPSESWFALQVIPQHEKHVAVMLESKGYEQFLPTFVRRRTWSDRVKTSEQPLFPGYVFCRVRQDSLGLLNTIPGVSRVVGFGGKPAYIPDEEISAVAQAVKSGLEVLPHASIVKIGQKVKVKSGPLSGVIGRLLRINNRRHLMLAIELAMKSIVIDVDACDIVALEAAALGG